MKGNTDIFLQIFRKKQLHVFAAALARTLFPPVPWLLPQMSHSSDSFKGNCQILILVPRKQRHTRYLKRPQLIFSILQLVQLLLYNTAKETQHSTVTKPKTRSFFLFFVCGFVGFLFVLWFFLFQDLEAVKGIHNQLKTVAGHTHAWNSEIAHLCLCWGLSEVPSQSPEHQNKAEHLRTLCFLLLGSVSMFILTESQDKVYHRIIFYTESYKRFSQNSLAVFTPKE